MKKFPVLLVLLVAIVASSCSRKVPEIVHNIPDHAFLVTSLHPKQIYDKGQIGTMDIFTKKIRNKIVLSLVKDPLQSGIDISEYMFIFVYFIDDQPVIGTTAVIKDSDKFASTIGNLLKDNEGQVIDHKGYSMVTPEDEELAIAWNEKQVIFLSSPQKNFTAEEWQTELVSLYDLSREEAVTSIVDFNKFTGKMKDFNVWFTGDELKKIMEKTNAFKEMQFELPMELYNNYGQVFVDFSDGAMYVHSETHFSDDVTKAAESFLVAKESLNKDLLKLTPGNNLILAMAFSVELDKMVKMMKNFGGTQMDSVSGKIEKATGVSGDVMLEAMSGDFVLAINGSPEGASIPVEILIGIGLDDETLQDKLMGTVNNMAQVEKDGDFFMINVNGMELYSGIVNGIWVITNVSGYKSAVTGSGLEKTLSESKFNDYAGGSMGMYMNLDLTTYPSSLQGMMAQGGMPGMLELVAESMSYIGIEGSNYENDITVKTSKEKENSLYTLLQLMEKAAEGKAWSE
ncbi:MAG: DUF4836 family protein [Bacteroidales bacterium]